MPSSGTSTSWTPSGRAEAGEINVMREDEVTPSLPQEEVLSLTREPEDGFIRAPKVME
jgi:aspartyl/glutamyl-tRNA(Asn/Gln) amidotransferase C subunit